MNYKSIKQYLLAISMLLCGHMIQAEIPQPGENLWHVLANIGTDIDQINTQFTTDFNGTFTVITTIQNGANTASAALDALKIAVLADFAGTFSALANIQCNASSSSGCQSIPLELLPTGTIISSPGIYCLANDATLNAGASITIASSNVTLDLNSYTITNSAVGNTITATSVNNVTIKNGSIVNTGTGVSTTIGINIASGMNITIENMYFDTCLKAIAASTITYLNIQNSNAYNCANNEFALTTNPIMDIESCTNVILNNCQATQPPATTGYTGFSVTSSSSNVTLTNCISSQNNIGFELDDYNNLTCRNCIASNAATTPTIGYDGFRFGSSASASGYLIDCVSSHNAGNGFNLLSSTGPTPQTIFENCIASGNIMVGFNLERANTLATNCYAILNGPLVTLTAGFLIAATNNTLRNCISNLNNVGILAMSSASNCLISGCKCIANTTNGIDMSAGPALSTVELCSSNQNTDIGINGAGTSNNNVIFYLNNAINNAVSDNYSGIGSLSAPQTTLASLTRLYGDNLKNN